MTISMSNILTFPELNQKFGIQIVHNFLKHNYSSNITLEIIGEELYGKFQINVDIYDDNGNLIMPIRNILIDGETFDGIIAKKIDIYDNHLDALVNNHIRIYPTNSYLEEKHFNSMTLIQVGINIEERRKYINRLNIGDSVILTLDNYNEFDKYAVKVSDFDGNHIGFLKSDCAFIYNQFIKDNDKKIASIIKKNKSSIYLKSPIIFDSKEKFLFGE